MTTLNTQYQNLSYLERHANESLEIIDQLTPNPSQQKHTKSSSDSKTLKKIKTLSRDIQNFVNYTKHLLTEAEHHQKLKQKKKEQFCMLRQELSEAEIKVAKLEDQSMESRKKLNQKQKEIQKLELIKEIDASFTESIYFNDQTEPERNECENDCSFISELISSNLDIYESGNVQENVGNQNGQKNEDKPILSDLAKTAIGSSLCISSMKISVFSEEA